MWLCDECGANLVLAKQIKPLCEVWGTGQRDIPFKFLKCDKCDAKENCMNYPDCFIKDK